MLQPLFQLIAVAREYIAPYLRTVTSILKDSWTQHLENVLPIVQQIAVFTTDHFTLHLPKLLPLLLSGLALLIDAVGNFEPLQQTLICLSTLRWSLCAHVHLCAPALCKLITQLLQRATASA